MVKFKNIYHNRIKFYKLISMLVIKFTAYNKIFVFQIPLKFSFQAVDNDTFNYLSTDFTAITCGIIFQTLSVH